MKFLLTVPSVTSGSGLTKYILTLAKILSDQGHDVELLTTHMEDAEYEIAQAECHGLKKCHQLGKKSKFAKYMNAVKIIRAFKPDFIINNYNAVIKYIIPLISKQIKVIDVLHNDTDDFYRIGAINGNKTKGWIAPTRAIADHFNQYTANLYSKQVEVIPHGVEMPNYHPEFENKNDILELIYVGVLYEHKGVKILPDIISLLHQNNIKFHFTITGKGPLYEWLEVVLSNDIGSGTVTMTGVIPYTDVYDLQAKADIFVYPTHLDAFGLVIAEAMINGTVPIVTLLPGITDNLIDNKINGYLVPQDDVSAFVDTIKCLNDDPELIQRIKQAAYDKAKKELSRDMMAAKYVEYFHKLR